MSPEKTIERLSPFSVTAISIIADPRMWPASYQVAVMPFATRIGSR
jgi:hypothetical protein